MAEKGKGFLGKSWSVVSSLLPIVSSVSSSSADRNQESLIDQKIEKYRRRVMGNVERIAQSSIVALLAGLLFGSFTTGWHWEGIGILATAALACFLIGSTLGFVFGIPRSAQNPDGAPPPAAAQAQPGQTANDVRSNTNAAALRENTNLEQISDWFVKILIGAGLVQLDKVKLLFEGAAEKLSASLLVAKAAATAVPMQGTNTVMVNVVTNGTVATNQISLLANSIIDPANLASPFFKGHGDSFCLFLILYFMALGFLASYLITRLWLPYVMRTSALAVNTLELRQQLEEEIGEEKIKEGRWSLMQELGPTDKAPPPGDNAAGDQQPKPAARPTTRPPTRSATGAAGGGAPAAAVQPAEDPEDPNRGKFGRSPENNGFKLSGSVQKLDYVDDDYFRVKLRVARTDSQPFNFPVTFYLHPTFSPATRTVYPQNNEATLECFAWGVFTVGAEVDEGGKKTALELDLNQLPDAPALFKSR